VLVKICGTTSEDDALLAVAMGANALGFIFAPSPRQVTVQLVADIVKRLPRDEVLTVGVFKDEAPQRVVEMVYSAGLRAAQLHGHESAAEVRWVRQRVPMVVKALPAGDPRVARANEYEADAIMLDAKNPGSGKVFDWQLAGELPEGQNLLLAGGLDADNVAAAVRQLKPWGVDAASGVEASPGVKDPLKLKAFVEAARNAAFVAGLDHARGPGRAHVAPGTLYDWADDE
jgi:phosphoribosylanthranilate isomerase